MICVTLFLHQIHQYHWYFLRYSHALAFGSIVSSSLAIDTKISIYYINLLQDWNRLVLWPNRYLNTTVKFDRRTANLSGLYPILCWLEIAEKISMKTKGTLNKGQWYWNLNKKLKKIKYFGYLLNSFEWRAELTRLRCKDSTMMDTAYRWMYTIQYFPCNLHTAASITPLGRNFHCNPLLIATIAFHCPHSDVG